MADTKLTDLTELTSIATGDFLYVVDVSDTTDSTAGTSKKIQQANLIDTSTYVTLTGTQTLTNKTLTSPTVSSPTISGQMIIAGSDASNYSGVRFENNNGTAFSLTSLDFQNSGDTALSRIAHMIYSGGTSADLRFYLTNSGTTSVGVAFEHHGRIGIGGVTSPLTTLHALGEGIFELQSQDLFSGGVRVYKQGNNTSSTGGVKDTSEIGYHSFYGYDGTDFGRGAYVLVTATEDFTTTAHGMKYEIYTTPNGSTTAVSRFTIDNNGAVSIPTSLTVNSDTVTTNTATQTLTNKTLTSPVISTINNTGTLTLPTSTDTLVGRDTTDTLTNKTLTSPVLQTSFVAKGEYDNGNSGTTATITATNGDRQKITMTGNCTFTFSGFATGQALILHIVQDATGGRTITLPTVKWPGGTAGTFSTTASAIDLLTIYYDGTNYLCQLSAGFA